MQNDKGNGGGKAERRMLYLRCVSRNETRVSFWMVLNDVSLIRKAAVYPGFQFRNAACSLLYTSIRVRQRAGVLQGTKSYFMVFS